MTASPTEKLPVLLREHTPADLGFIVNAWITNYQKAGEVEDLTPDIYCPSQRGQINRFLRAGGCTLVVSEADPTQFFGFICFERDEKASVGVVHYVYVKKTFRGVGLGKQMVAHAFRGLQMRFYTHRAPRRQDERVLRLAGAKFNLFLR